MKLLFLLPSVPDPPDAGARLRNLGLLRLAARSHTVDAIAFGTTAEGPRLAALARRARVLPPPPTRGRITRVLHLVGSPHPDMAERLWAPSFQHCLADMLAHERYDAVQAEGIEMARYLDGVDGRPARVYDAHNAEFALQRRAAEWAWRRRRLGAAAYSRVQRERLARFEARIVRAADLTLAVSAPDAGELNRLGDPNRVAVVPNGIDVASFPFTAPTAGDEPALLFLGKLDYRPNAEALKWFLDAVLPRLHQMLPAARLFAVGHNPPSWLVRAGQADDRIAVTGGVVDERPYLARAGGLVLPVWFGGGSRLKALVAFASGVPVVSSPLGMTGLDVSPGRDFLQVDEPDAAAWARALAALLSDLATRERIAANARALVERRYDWSAIAPSLEAAYGTLQRA